MIRDLADRNPEMAAVLFRIQSRLLHIEDIQQQELLELREEWNQAVSIFQQKTSHFEFVYPQKDCDDD